MIEPRVYRAAFIPAVLAAVLAMFSLESRPRPLPQGLAADVLFDGRLAAIAAARIAERWPDRRPGSGGDRATAALVASSLRARGFRVERARFSHAGRALENVIGRRAGRTRHQIVLVAARDAARIPEASGSAADTAALLELARVFEGRPSRSTLVLASVDGSTLGEVGAARLAEDLGAPELVDGVLVVSDLGSGSRRGPFLQAWSNDSGRAGIGLQRTVADSIRQELDRPTDATGPLGQLARLAFPIGIGAQGVLLERGYEAVRVSGSGELPPVGPRPVSALDEDRLGTLGRATLRTVTALDQAGELEHGPRSYLTVVSQVVPGWAISLLAGALLLPALVAGIDAFARARRRAVTIGPWLRWVAAWAAPFLAGLAAAELLALAGATPSPPPAPVAPEDLPLDGAALAAMGGVALAMALGFALARFLATSPAQAAGSAGCAAMSSPAQAAGSAGRAAMSSPAQAAGSAGRAAMSSPAQALRELAAPGAGVALALTVGVATVALWLVNPYAALLAVPAAHLWTLAALGRPTSSRRVRALLVTLGALAPLLVALYYSAALSLHPLEGAWYLMLLVTGHSVDVVSALIACLMLGSLCAAAEIASRTPAAMREERPEAGGPPVYGPGSYAGPGSLGGTESALR